MAVKAPKTWLEVYLPSGRSNFVFDVRDCDPQPPRPVTLKCDFCNQHTDRLWCYLIRACGIDPIPSSPNMRVDMPDPNHWCACVYCHALLPNDLHLLAVRVSALLKADRSVYFRRLYEGLMAAWTGKMVTWESGQPWPPKIDPEDIR